MAIKRAFTGSVRASLRAGSAARPCERRSQKRTLPPVRRAHSYRKVMLLGRPNLRPARIEAFRTGHSGISPPSWNCATPCVPAEAIHPHSAHWLTAQRARRYPGGHVRRKARWSAAQMCIHPVSAAAFDTFQHHPRQHPWESRRRRQFLGAVPGSNSTPPESRARRSSPVALRLPVISMERNGVRPRRMRPHTRSTSAFLMLYVRRGDRYLMDVVAIPPFHSGEFMKGPAVHPALSSVAARTADYRRRTTRAISSA